MEQENARLKNERTADLVRQIDELKAENGGLKEKIIEISEEKGHLIVANNTLKEANQSLSMLGTDLASANETVRKEFFRADKNKDMWREKTEKLQQTLQEIKEIADALSCKHPEDCFENKPDWNGEVYGCNVADDWKKPSDLATCPSKLASAILQIITKAEEE